MRFLSFLYYLLHCFKTKEDYKETYIGSRINDVCMVKGKKDGNPLQE